MKIYNRVKSYIFTPRECFIPRCLARCCTNVPLPEGFVETHRPFLRREIHSAINIGVNDIQKDNFNSIVYNTTYNPLQLVGIDQTGRPVVGIPADIVKRLNEQQLQACYEHYNQFDNYCPFITETARCNVYKQRPRICREYGSFPGIENICHEKSSRFDILKFIIKQIPKFIKEDCINAINYLKNIFAKNN